MAARAAASGSATVPKDFSSHPYNYVTLDREGNLLDRIIVTIDISYRAPKVPRNAMQSMAFQAMHIFESFGCPCPRRYEIKRESLSREFSGINFPHAIKEHLRDLRRSYPRDVHSEVVSTTALSLEAPEPPTEELIKRMQAAAERAYGVRPSDSELQALLIARSQALKARRHSTLASSVLCVSSKSPYFSGINSQIKTANMSQEETEGPLSTLASVRVYPDGSSSLSLPRCQKFIGGLKVVPAEIYLSPDETTILAMRRNKSGKTHRSEDDLTTLSKGTGRTLPLSSPYLVTPLFVILHPKHGMEFLSPHCRGELFNLFRGHYDLSRGEPDESNAFTPWILSTPIDRQLDALLNNMAHIVKAMQYLQENDLLHNDLKPENIMIDEDGVAKLIDFDFMQTKEEGSRGCNKGTLTHVIPGYTKRNLRSELYALAQTFWYTKAEFFSSSFMLAFDSLHRIAYRNENRPQARRIARITRQIKELHNLLIRGTSPDTSYTPPSFAEILSRIETMKMP